MHEQEFTNTRKRKSFMNKSSPTLRKRKSFMNKSSPTLGRGRQLISSYIQPCTGESTYSLLRDRFHPYHQKIGDWQIEETLGHNIVSISFHMLKWLQLVAKSDGGSCSLPLHFFSFFFSGKNFFVILQKIKIN